MSLQDTQTSNWYFSNLKLITSHFHNHGLSIIFFFILILLVAFFFFYFVCKFNFFSSEILSSSSVPGDANAVLVQINKGLGEETIQKLPIFFYGETCKLGSVKESDECPICLGLFGDDEMVKLLPNCEHVYHVQCIDKWLIAHSNCPLCRASLHLNSSITCSEVVA